MSRKRQTKQLVLGINTMMEALHQQQIIPISSKQAIRTSVHTRQLDQRLQALPSQGILHHSRKRTKATEQTIPAAARAHTSGPARQPRAHPCSDIQSQSEGIARGLADQLRNDTSQYRLSPEDPSVLEDACETLQEHLQSSAPGSTLSSEKSAWKWWTRWCTFMGTTPFRTDAQANLGIDLAGARREALLQAASLPWILARMKARGRASPLPRSAFNVVLHVRRVHKRMGYPLVQIYQVQQTLDSLMHAYCEEHGPEFLLPKRKDPFRAGQVEALLSLCDSNGIRLGNTTTDHSKLQWVSMSAMIATMAQSGMRKDEVTSKRAFTKRDLSRASLSWLIGGLLVRSPTPIQLASLVPGEDYAILTPAPAKADKFGTIYGNLPIYLPYHPGEAINAATRLRDLESAWPLSDTSRREHPLFVENSKEPVSASRVHQLFRKMLAYAIGQVEADKHSFHSFRITLACQCLAAGMSEPQILAICRWQSTESLKIYARMGAQDYANILTAAGSADITAVTTSQIPELDASHTANLFLTQRLSVEVA